MGVQKNETGRTITLDLPEGAAITVRSEKPGAASIAEKHEVERQELDRRQEAERQELDRRQEAEKQGLDKRQGRRREECHGNCAEQRSTLSININSGTPQQPTTPESSSGQPESGETGPQENTNTSKNIIFIAINFFIVLIDLNFIIVILFYHFFLKTHKIAQ